MSCRATINCPKCKAEIQVYKNPAPTVDAIIYDDKKGILLIERKFEPFGWALPGGFVDYGEAVEAAVIREAKEETGLDVTVKALVGVYSNPIRDPRRHTITTAFWCIPLSYKTLQAGDDAGKAQFFTLDSLPETIVFDHKVIIDDFMNMRQERTNVAWR